MKTIFSVTVKGTVDEAKQILHDAEEQVINTVWINWHNSFYRSKI